MRRVSLATVLAGTPLALFPLPAWAHPGHGATLPGHHLTGAPQVALAAGLVALAAAAWWAVGPSALRRPRDAGAPPDGTPARPL